MSVEPQIPTSEVPQAEDLSEVREVVSAIRDVGVETEQLAEHTGFSIRHVCYRLHAAEVLGLLDADRAITGRGRVLLATSPGSENERQTFRQAVESCQVVKLVVPDLFESETFELETVAGKLEALAGLSKSTAERRARVLAAWRRQLAA